MLGSIFWNVLGLFIQVIGAFMCIQSFVFTTPKAIADALASIHGNRLRDRNLDTNRFLDSLVRQSLDAQNGFAMIIVGALVQAISSLFTHIQTTKVSVVVVVISYVAVLLILWFGARKISSWRRKRAQQSISATASNQAMQPTAGRSDA